MGKNSREFAQQMFSLEMFDEKIQRAVRAVFNGENVCRALE
jgi:hypothetical protein